MSEEEIQQEYEAIDRSKKDPFRFWLVVEKYFDRIFNFIYTQPTMRILTADLCSQTFLIALSRAHQFQFRGVPVLRLVFTGLPAMR